MKRTKRLGPGKKTKAKREAMRSALEGYASWNCQVSGWPLVSPVPHHKTPRSELRKAGVKDLDAPERLLIIRADVHTWIHGGQMGRPKDPVALARFEEVERSTANAANMEMVQLSPQTRLDLQRYLESRYA